jgi:hypothetical protein
MQRIRTFQGVGVVLLLGLVQAACHTVDLVGAAPQVDEGGTGGTTTGQGGTPGQGGNLFDPGVVDDIPCCYDLAPFQGLAFFTDSDTPCPAGTDEGQTLFADFLPPAPHTCACACAKPSCSLPDGMHTNAAKCPGDGSTALAFGPGNGWDGACSTQDPVPAGIQCAGVPCVQSVTVPALAVSPCAPSDPVVSKEDPSWGRTVRECTPDLSSEGCAPGEVCPPEPPPGFDLCLYADGVLACPPGWQQLVSFTGAQDDRQCDACACGPPDAMCEAYVIAYSDAACGAPAGSVIATIDEAACFDVPSGMGLGSVEATFLGQAPGSCAPGGGAPVGDVKPSGPVTLCCRGANVAPG